MHRMTNSERATLYSLGFGCVLSGAILIGLGLPLTYLTAAVAGRDPTASILLVHAGHDWKAFVRTTDLSNVTAAEWSTVAGTLAFAGGALLTVPLIFWIVRRGGILRFITLMQGMYLGLGLTSTWFEWSNTGRLDLLAPRALETGYLYLAFLVAEASKLTLEDKELSALPYLYAIDGLFGTVAVLIIQVGYEPSFASLLLGPFFLISVSVSILIAEWLVLRPSTIVIVATGLALFDLEREGSVTSLTSPKERRQVAFRHLRVKFREIARLPYSKRVKLIENAASVVRRLLPRRPRGAKPLRLDWRIVLGICVGEYLFLLLVIVVAWALF
jgi:hypothetical protein